MGIFWIPILLDPPRLRWSTQSHPAPRVMFLLWTTRSPLIYATSSMFILWPHWNKTMTKYKWRCIDLYLRITYLMIWSTRFSIGQAIRFRQNTGDSIFSTCLVNIHLATSKIGYGNFAKWDQDNAEDETRRAWHPECEWWRAYSVGGFI